jgi:hypothetical protein
VYACATLGQFLREFTHGHTLVVRRVRDRARTDELFPVWRYHPFFTNSTPLPEAPPCVGRSSTAPPGSLNRNAAASCTYLRTGPPDNWTALWNAVFAVATGPPVIA